MYSASQMQTHFPNGALIHCATSRRRRESAASTYGHLRMHRGATGTQACRGHPVYAAAARGRGVGRGRISHQQHSRLLYGTVRRACGAHTARHLCCAGRGPGPYLTSRSSSSPLASPSRGRYIEQAAYARHLCCVVGGSRCQNDRATCMR
jgi:hypothetical protein